MSIINQITGGSFQDSEGNLLSNGYLIFELSQDGIVNTNTQVCRGTSIKIILDSSGNIPLSPTYSLWPNDSLTPTGTFYTVSGYTKQGQLVWGPYPQTVLSTPIPYDISSWVPGKI